MAAAAEVAGGGGGGLVGGAGGTGSTPPETSPTFVHGVGSGDPLSDRVILWTRVTVASPGALNLSWEVASDSNFGAIVARGTVGTGPEQDYTVKVDATGLQPASVYFYRFMLGAEPSPVGRTQTLPVGSVSQLRLGIVSCSNFPSGYFNVCADLAKRTDIDVVLHLGDYIYEYGPLGYASQLAIAIDRESAPSHEILSLEDYRQRHRQNRADPDLIALHAKVPVIAIWDDHDVADNAWSGGAKNHDPATEELRRPARRGDTGVPRVTGVRHFDYHKERLSRDRPASAARTSSRGYDMRSYSSSAGNWHAEIPDMTVN